MHVEDHDGNVIRFGSDATDEPIGEWLDIEGVSWTYSPDGTWNRIG
ncbi:hypothetical protein [Brevundimonas sp. GCM10030266]